jgi:hypothetical protein
VTFFILTLWILDLCAAIIGDHSTVLSLEHWTPSDVPSTEVFGLFRSSGSPDMWANYAVFLTAKVCHFIWCQTKNIVDINTLSNQSSFPDEWLDLWKELETWHQNRPSELLEFDFHDGTCESTSSPFPFVLFAAPSAISSNQLYHTACLLLMDSKPSSVDLSLTDSTSVGLWHARRICGISATNEHHGCLNNAIQP